MEIKIKKLHPDAIIPKYAKSGDAGMDLTAINVTTDYGCLTYHTGLAVEIPRWHVGLLFPRSSVYKGRQILTNCVGVIDSGYTGEVFVNCINTGPDVYTIYAKRKLPFQIVVVKCDNDFQVVTEEEYLNLTSTAQRQDGQVGSSD